MKYVLPIIVFAQFAGTSMWFAVNAVMDDMAAHFEMPPESVAHLTSIIQFGFIVGTLIYAFSNLADRFSPSKVFLISSLAGATCNIIPLFIQGGEYVVYFSRFTTGFFLAGIYPVGMKIASDWYEKGLGKALGYLVGALVLGTAFPHLLKTGSFHLQWMTILWTVSLLSVSGALLLYWFVGDGPHRHRGTKFQIDAFGIIFRNRDFRAAAFGYFGHMWELYAFWAFVPLIIVQYNQQNALIHDPHLWSFIIIAAGSAGCILGGIVSKWKGSAKVAFVYLAISMTLCLLSAWSFNLLGPIFILFMIIWGFVVVGDSPQFSTLNAKTAPKEFIGSALTFATCIGFGITIFSIQILQSLADSLPFTKILWILAIGPAFGLFTTFRLLKKKI